MNSNYVNVCSPTIQMNGALLYLYSTIGFLRFCLPNVYVHSISQSKLDLGNYNSECENTI